MRRESISTMVAREHGGFTVTDAARMVGRSADTLTRWRRNGTYVPRKKVKVGELEVFVYTPKDIEALKKIAADLKPGRKSKG